VKISIALCTYNGEQYLWEQLDSIARQTLLPDEVIVFDDCSSDGTIGLLTKFRETATFPVRIHQNENNLGSTRNFEQAILLCGGDIIALCDQDDFWREDKLKRIMEAFVHHPEADYVFSDGELVDDALISLNSSLWEAAEFHGEISNRYAGGEQLFGFFRRQFVTGAAMAFRARLKEYIFPFPENPQWIHDGWIAVVGSAIGGGGIPLAEPLIRYRQHHGQQFGAVVSEPSSSLCGDFLNLRKKRAYFIEQWTIFAEIFPYLLVRLKERGSKSEPDFLEKVSLLEAFQLFFYNRLQIFTSGLLRKTGLITSELVTGRYKRFANSWKSALADLLL
jgi:glycosyltransferase involved in cell wall biosynthesis